MSRVLLAGGAGFLGSHLAERLLLEGNEVTVVDNLSSGSMENIANISGKIRFIESDIINLEYDLPVDFVLNLASRASRAEWEKFPVEVALSNSEGSNVLIKLALKNGARYLFASSSEVYGKPAEVPTPENYNGNVSSTGSRSPYDEGKRFGEAIAKAYEREYNLDCIIMRLFNTYGPRMRGGDQYGRVIDRFIRQALSGDDLTVYGDGKQTRSFTYVADTINAIVLLTKLGKKGSVFNIGSDVETEIIDIARLVIRTANSGSGIRFLDLPEDDPPRRGAENSSIRSLGWMPDTGLEEGIRKTVHYYRNK